MHRHMYVICNMYFVTAFNPHLFSDMYIFQRLSNFNNNIIPRGFIRHDYFYEITFFRRRSSVSFLSKFKENLHCNNCTYELKEAPGDEFHREDEESSMQAGSSISIKKN